MSTNARILVLARVQHVDEDGHEYWFTAIDGYGFDLSQRYALYCRLAGVRCQGNLPVADHCGRGTPPWCPSEVKERFSHLEQVTWLTPTEFLTVLEAFTPDQYDGGWTCLAKCISELASYAGNDRVRVLLGFM